MAIEDEVKALSSKFDDLASKVDAAADKKLDEAKASKYTAGIIIGWAFAAFVAGMVTKWLFF